MFEVLVKIDLTELTLEKIHGILTEKMTQISAAKSAVSSSDDQDRATQVVKDLEMEYVALSAYLTSAFQFSQLPKSDTESEDPSLYLAKQLLIAITDAVLTITDTSFTSFIDKLNTYKQRFDTNPYTVFLFADKFLELSLGLNVEAERQAIVPTLKRILKIQQDIRRLHVDITVFGFFKNGYQGALSKFEEAQRDNQATIEALERDKQSLQQQASRLSHAAASVRSTSTVRSFFRQATPGAQKIDMPPQEAFDDCIMASIYWTRSRATLFAILLKHYRFQAMNFVSSSPSMGMHSQRSAKDSLWDYLLFLCNEQTPVAELIRLINSDSLLRSTSIKSDIDLAHQAKCFEDLQALDPLPGFVLPATYKKDYRTRLIFKLNHQKFVFDLLAADDLVPAEANPSAQLAQHQKTCSNAAESMQPKSFLSFLS